MWPFRKQSLSAEFYYLYNRLIQMEKRIMVGQVELDAKLDELKASVDKELQQLADAVAASAPDLSPQVKKVQDAIDALNADDPVVAPPEAPAAQ
jgi:hypothetical protein